MIVSGCLTCAKAVFAAVNQSFDIFEFPGFECMGHRLTVNQQYFLSKGFNTTFLTDAIHIDYRNCL